jgi:uncharacterized repeat protein (TIGR01451 family)
MQLKRGVVVIGAFLLGAGAFGVSALAAGEGRPNVVVDVLAMKEVVQRDNTGRQTIQLREPEPTGPGDTLVYRIHYRNEGTAPAHDTQLIDPIPAGTLLVPGSWDAKGGDFSVSTDGGKTFERYPVRRAVKQTDGTTKLQDVELSAYTHVRWTAREPLPPGAERMTAFKVKVQ